ncbi:MAG: MarR family transcriptional regulator [Alphaproteobacteria bacterium]|jgi:DNA-binding MarR family transcriptional regulator|nr:MarR family transcriptional regulator [Alphaproteobacteria bacterium]HJP20458.1 MarR family transcriptional regulator [Alphaproteobacteria bacterium]
MADVKPVARKDAILKDNVLDEEEIRQGIELLFYAYRDFTSDPDAILSGSGFGRAHHRVVHFVGRRPGITVAELLDILRITKQSLSRVLSQLIERGYIVQQKGTRDRRQRLLYLTDEGTELERSLARPQHKRVGDAYREAGPEAVAAYRKILLGLINESDREAVLKSFRGR